MNLRKPTRREFLLGAAAAPLVAVSAASAYADIIEPHNYQLSLTTVAVKDLPPAFEGYRIAQVSDVHHSRIVSLGEVERVVSIAQSASPDLIVLTGDYTTTYRRYVEPCAQALGKLRAPDGVWAVLGNHDHYTDPKLTTWALRRAGINVLDNANSTIRRGSDSIQLIGIDDFSWNATNWNRAMWGTNPGKPSILLSHQPSVLDMAETSGVSLILSGHTHGGQVRLPFIGAPARFASDDFKYIAGLYRRGDTQLYVSRGTGVIGLPVRFGARPEVSIIKLTLA
jgi:uncharacterized protein